MKNIRHIKFLTFTAVALIFLLQVVWIVNVFRLTQKQIFNQVNIDFEESVNEEMFGRITLQENQNIAGGVNTEIVGSIDMGENKEITSSYLIFQEYLFQKGVLPSLSKLDTLFQEKISNHEIRGRFIINRINTATGDILETTDKKGKGKLLGAFKSKTIYTRTDKIEGMQVWLISPYFTTLLRMTLILILSVLLVAGVSFALSYQMRSFLKERQLRQMQADFSHALTHDMATQLQTISQVNSLLNNEKLYNDPDKRKRYIDIARQQIMNLQALTDRILTVARAEKSDLELSLSTVNIKEIIFPLIDKFSVQTNKDVKFNAIFTPEEFSIYVDETLLSNAVSNLIDNALKYSGNTVRIDIDCNKKQNSLIISVKDNGYGISKKDQAVIFAKFERGKALLRNEAKGFGIGLSYVKKVMEAHGGTIDLFSFEGEGSEFILFLPLKESKNKL